MGNKIHAALFVFVLALSPYCRSQNNKIRYGHNWQISGKLTVGMYVPEIRLDSETELPILAHDKTNGLFLRPELEVRIPAGLVLSVGYFNASIKSDPKKILDQLQKENEGYSVSDSVANFASYQSGFSPGIGWRFQFVERAFIQPHINWITGRYASPEATYTLTNQQTNETTSQTFEKGLHPLKGIFFGLNINTEYEDLLGDGSGLWYGLSIGWSKVKAKGDVSMFHTDVNGTSSQQITPFDKTWSSLSLGITVGLLFNIKKQEKPH
jgi:hypothetical protein